MALYHRVALAAAFTPRLPALLAETRELLQHVGGELAIIHAGEASDEKRARFRSALETASLPPETPVHFAPGNPSAAILRVVDDQRIDLLVAGALEKERGLRYFLGSVARDLVREAPCALILYTAPRENPEPVRQIVVVADFSEVTLIALQKAVRFAESAGARRVQVVRVYPTYGETIALTDEGRGGRSSYRARTLADEEALLADVIDAVGRTSVDVEPVTIDDERHAGHAVSRFARSNHTDLLVMPSARPDARFLERLFPSDMEWVLREIPCNLWVARERLV